MRNEDPVAYPGTRLSWKVVESGLWIRFAIAGVAVAGLGVALAVTGDGSLFASLGAIAAGAFMAVTGYRQAVLALDDLDGKEAGAPVAEPATGAAQGAARTRLELGFARKA